MSPSGSAVVSSVTSADSDIVVIPGSSIEVVVCMTSPVVDAALDVALTDDSIVVILAEKLAYL